MIEVAPSILAADLLNIGSGVQRMLDAGCDLLHVDIMDAHFVPNLSYGPAMVQALHERWPELRLDVHLMMEHPEQYLRVFADSGAWNITVHAEIPGDIGGILTELRGMGVHTGLSLKPGTPAEKALPYLSLCDLVLVMTVEPGFGGQRFQPQMAEKLRALRAAGYRGQLEADGGVKLSNLQLLCDSGLDLAVMGTALFRTDDPKTMIEQVHALRPAEAAHAGGC